MRCMIYDTETGGLDPEKHSVFSVGALVGDLDTGEIIESFEAYHKLPSVHDYVYTEGALNVHKITPQEAFDKGIPTEELQERFTDLWHNHGASIIGGHNEPFDRRMMSFGVYEITVPEFEANFTYRALDSMSLIRIFTGHEHVKSGATLTQTIKALNIDMSDVGKDKFHAALFDSICCFRVLHRFRSVFSNPDFAKALING